MGIGTEGFSEWLPREVAGAGRRSDPGNGPAAATLKALARLMVLLVVLPARSVTVARKVVSGTAGPGTRKTIASSGSGCRTCQLLSGIWNSTLSLCGSGLASLTLNATSTPFGLGGKVCIVTSGGTVSTTTVMTGVR